MIARSSSLLLLLSVLCKHFNVGHYSQSIKGVNTNLEILTHHKVWLPDKRHSSKSDIFGVMPLLN